MENKDYILDQKSIDLAECIIKETAENLVRWFVEHESEDHNVQLIRLTYTLQVVTMQKAYELLGNNAAATARLLKSTEHSTRRAIKKGKIDVG